MGRSAIYNIVSTYSPTIDREDYVDLIEELEKLGCDVDHQDNSGQTAFHAAARFRNDRAIFALLAAGADVNIIDGIGKTAFVYSMAFRRVESQTDSGTFVEGRNREAVQLFINHVQKLQLAGLHVIPQNVHSPLAWDLFELYVINIDERRFRAMLDGIDNVSVNSKSLTLRDFISENGPMWKYYSQMKQMVRADVIELFDTILNKQNHKLGELRDLVKLQYRNYLAKPRLIEDAKFALSALTNILVPDLCSELILAFCANWELKNVIKAAN